ncbi:MAG: radical SAM protein [Deltaproteobacteria bacterium]|nr:radical SAM protein [Deltaproteobacteria bacterium]
MKILFSNPPWEVEGRHTVRAGSRWPHSYKTTPGAKYTYKPFPFFLSYAASYCQERLPNSEIILRDSLLNQESVENFLSFLLKNEFDYLVFEISTPSLDSDRVLIQKIAHQNPKTKIILVGQNIAYDAKNLLDTLPVFACIKGEYEKGVAQAISGNRGGVLEFNLLDQTEMDAAPAAMRREGLYEYYDVGYFHGKGPILQLWTSRGCPFKCSFCTWPQSMTLNKVRYYSADSLRKEITQTLKKFPSFKAIYFDDDTFNLNDRHVLEVCKVVEEFKLPWSAMCRADTLKESTWEAMASADCVGVKIGVESASQRILDEVIHKNLNLEDVRHFVPFIRSLGIKVHGTFMYGNPTETEEEMLATKRFIEEVGFDHVQESGAAPLAGTKLWNLNEQTHLLNETDGKKYQEALERKLVQYV